MSQNQKEITKDTVVQATESEINFLHGRIGASVFMQNYFNIAWITDLKKRLFTDIKQILKEIS